VSSSRRDCSHSCGGVGSLRAPAVMLQSQSGKANGVVDTRAC
jgi:hypothetical protein